MFHNKLIVFTLLLTGCTLICAAQIDINLSKAELPLAASDDVDKKKTTAAPTTTSSSSTSTTTTTTTTTTTQKPTLPPVTTTAKPNTTTVAPITTTVAPITTPAPAPAPYPEPSIGQWNSSCILVKMAAQLNFTYETKDKNSTTTLYNIPTDALLEDAHCANLTQSIQINWGAAATQSSMLLQFELKNSSVELTMLRFIIVITGDRFPDALDNQTIQLLYQGADFESPVKMSYHCTRAQQFNLTETVIDKNITGIVTVRDVQVEAFRIQGNSTVFSSARDCDSTNTSDIVPIAVGIALVALIAIVLIAYLCARRRSTSRGYVSF